MTLPPVSFNFSPNLMVKEFPPTVREMVLSKVISELEDKNLSYRLTNLTWTYQHLGRYEKKLFLDSFRRVKYGNMHDFENLLGL